VATQKPAVGQDSHDSPFPLRCCGADQDPPEKVNAFPDESPAAHLTSVSCATATFCMATGNMHSYRFTGGTWGRGVLVEKTNKLISISCPSSTFCAVVDSAGNAFIYSGSGWSAPKHLSDTTMVDVSCGAAGSCMAAGQTTPYAYSNGAWTPSGPLVTADGGPVHLGAVSCSSASTCEATGNADGYAYSGGHWAKGIVVQHTNKLTSLSCPSADYCVATDSGGNVYTYSL
jgi:hypothetical protein